MKTDSYMCHTLARTRLETRNDTIHLVFSLGVLPVEFFPMRAHPAISCLTRDVGWILFTLARFLVSKLQIAGSTVLTIYVLIIRISSTN